MQYRQSGKTSYITQSVKFDPTPYPQTTIYEDSIWLQRSPENTQMRIETMAAVWHHPATGWCSVSMGIGNNCAFAIQVLVATNSTVVTLDQNECSKWAAQCRSLIRIYLHLTQALNNRKGITPYTSFCYRSVNVNIHSLHTNPNTFLPRHGTYAFPTFSKIMQTFANQINLISNPYPPDPNLPFE